MTTRHPARPQRRPALALALALALLLLVPAARADISVIIPGGPVNIYATAHLGSPVITVLPAGTRVEVVSYNDNWATLRIGDGLGYAVTSYLGLGTSHVVTVPPIYVTPAPSAAPAHEKVDTDGANATVRTANHGPLHLREGPGMDAGLIDTYANGSRVRVLEQEGEWYRVLAGTREGYMSSRFIALDSGEELPEASRYAAVVDNPGANETLHLRALPSTDAAILGSYYDGTELTVLQVGEKWHEVTVVGKRGYMMAEFVRLLSDTQTPDRETAGPVPVYTQADASSALLATVPAGSIVTMITPGPDFSLIRYAADGVIGEGFAPSAALHPIDPIVTEINGDNNG